MMQNNEGLAVLTTHVMDDTLKFDFDGTEKLIMIELNPYSVTKDCLPFFNQLKGFTFRFLDEKLGTCLEMKYSKSNFIMDCQGRKQQETDQRLIITVDKNSNAIVDTQGVWIYLNVEKNILNIGYGEPRIETTLKKYDITLLRETIQNIKSVVIFQEGISPDFFKILQTKNLGLHRPIRIHTKNFYIEQISEVISSKFSNIFELNKGVNSQQLAKEIDSLYQAASKIKLHDLFHVEKQSIKFHLGELIHHSVTIEGCILNKIIRDKQEKMKLKGLDPFMTYLRVGLGQNNLFSAGHQFVLEVWPFKHYSSIHDHAGQYGLVKVLQGTIFVNVYAMLSNAPHLKDPIKKLVCNKNDITWLAPRVNQVHQLTNYFPQTGITLQCYKQSELKKDKQKVFNYVANNQYHFFTPQSDVADFELQDVFTQLTQEYRNLYKQNCQVFYR